MANYVLIHGAGSSSWYWHLVRPDLEARGHMVIAPDLPCDDDSAGLPEYVATVVDAVDGLNDLIVVAQSMAGFTAPLLCDHLDVRLIILVAAMVPLPGESPGEWWTSTGHEEAMRAQAERDGRILGAEFEPVSTFLHDVPADIVAEAAAHVRVQSGTPFVAPWPLAAWPDVPTRFLLCTNDRFFPAEFQRRVVRQRLDVTPDELVSGHLPALGHPKELVERLEAYRMEA